MSIDYHTISGIAITDFLQLPLLHPEHTFIFVQILLSSSPLFHLVLFRLYIFQSLFSIQFSSSSYTAFPSMINFLLIFNLLKNIFLTIKYAVFHNFHSNHIYIYNDNLRSAYGAEAQINDSLLTCLLLPLLFIH